MKERKFLRRREVVAMAAAAALAPLAAAAQPRPEVRPAYVVDGQAHIWSGGKPTPAQRQEPFSKDQLLVEMTAAGVDRAILVPTSWDPRGNQTALDAALAHPDRFAVMGLMDIT